VSQADWDYFTEQSKPTPEYIEETIVPLRDWGLVDLVTPDLSITGQVDLLAAPGHTPGNSVVRVASGGETLFFLGDLVHYIGEVQHLDLMPDGDPLPHLVPASRKRIFDMAVQQSALVTASHLPLPAVGNLVRRDGATTSRTGNHQRGVRSATSRRSAAKPGCPEAGALRCTRRAMKHDRFAQTVQTVRLRRQIRCRWRSDPCSSAEIRACA
jgi:glyoxylase-like metal-dependent hydrolase (beta-lactamase superfamily II)